MTPQEKAKKLVDSFEDELMECDTYFLETAKQRCALIAVDEVLRSHHNLYGVNNKQVKFYVEVQQEIEKL